MATDYASAQKQVRYWSKIILSYFFEIKIQNAEYAENLEGPLILAATHKSYIDHFLIIAALPDNPNLFPIRALASVYWMKMPLIGKWLKNLGALPANRGGGAKAPLKILKEKEVLGIYPEGGIRRSPGVHDLKRGAGWFALKSGAKILPVAIKGLDNFSLLRLPFYLFKKGKVTVAFGQAFLPFENQDESALTEELRKRMSELYKIDIG